MSLPLDEAILAALAKLGATEAEVVATLVAGGWRGKPVDGCKCPVAVYLAAMGFDVVIDPMVVTLEDGDEVPTPDPVADFILAFDNGEHEELDLAVRVAS
jgi:hypothetical protein